MFRFSDKRLRPADKEKRAKAGTILYGHHEGSVKAIRILRDVRGLRYVRLDGKSAAVQECFDRQEDAVEAATAYLNTVMATCAERIKLLQEV